MPVHLCTHTGKPGWQWGQQKCYVGPGAKRKAAIQGSVIERSGYKGNAAPNPLRMDPTRTATLRRQFETELTRRFNRLQRAINDLLVVEDALGLALNYNPSQPRDTKGRWSSGGSGSIAYTVEGTIAGEEAPFPDKFKELGDDVFTKYAQKYESKLTDKEADALSSYSDANFINEPLREGTVHDPLDIAMIDTLDSAIAKGKAPINFRVDRIIRIDPDDEVLSLKGKIISDPAYISTSTHGESYAKLAAEVLSEDEELLEITGSQFVKFKVLIPKGSPVALLGKSGIASDNEVLLPRNAPLKIHDVYEERRDYAKIAGRRTYQIIAEYVPITHNLGVIDESLNYNPNQPRDSRGRWGSGGGGVSSKVLGVAESLLTKTKEDGLEHAAVLTQDGSVLFENSGNTDSVAIPNTLLADKNNILVHTHPYTREDIPFSPGDWEDIAHRMPKTEVLVTRFSVYTLEKKADQLSQVSAPTDVRKQFFDFGREYTGTHQHEPVQKRINSSLHHACERMADYFGYRYSRTPVSITKNARWAFHSTSQQVEAFQRWLAQRIQADIYLGAKATEAAYWQAYVEEGYRKGAGRAFDDANKAGLHTTTEKLDFYRGTKEQFLRSAFGRPVAVEKVKLLASRTLTDLKGVTDAMATVMSRTLTDGLVQGKNPREIARDLTKALDSVGRTRALTIARTEIIRAHAEGQLDALEEMGVDEVGVMVEWATAGFNVCPLCEAMSGSVMTIKEARGLIPRHPNCRCAHIPANVGESKHGQKRGKATVTKALESSILQEGPKRGISLESLRKRSTWAGADRTIAKQRPRSRG